MSCLDAKGVFGLRGWKGFGRGFNPFFERLNP